MIGSPTPMRIPLVLAAADSRSAIIAYPIAPQEWHFRQSIEYSMSFNRAVIDYASRMTENLLFNIYKMGTALDRARQPGHVDAVADADSRPQSGCDRAAADAAAAADAEREADAMWAALHNAGAARSARLHHSVGPAGLSDRDRSSSTRCASRASPCSARRASSTVGAARRIRPARSS